LGIRERVLVLHRASVNHVAHGELHDLAALGPGNVADLDDLRGHVARRRVGANARLDAIGELVVERSALLQLHEQDDADVTHFAGRPVLADDDAFDDLGHLLDLAIDLGRPDAHAARIERCIGAAVDDEAVVRGDLDPIAMTPDAGKPLEVRRAVLAAVGIVPETDRHGGKRALAHELALLLADGTAVLVEHVDVEPETAALQLAA